MNLSVIDSNQKKKRKTASELLTANFDEDLWISKCEDVLDGNLESDLEASAYLDDLLVAAKLISPANESDEHETRDFTLAMLFYQKSWEKLIERFIAREFKVDRRGDCYDDAQITIQCGVVDC